MANLTKAPPIRKDGTPRWLYETLRRINDRLGDDNNQIYAISRGESSFGGGTPLAGVTDHGALTGLTPDDDHSQYLLLRGRTGGQTAFGSIDLTQTNPWIDSGSAFTIQKEKLNNGSSWPVIAITNSAAIGSAIVLVLATHTPGTGTGPTGTTNFHTGLTDTKGNTWTKHREYTNSDFAGVEEVTVSIWTSILTSALTAGVDTMAASFAMTIGCKAIESYKFTIPASSTIVLAGSGVASDTSVDPSSMSLSGLIPGAYLFVRGISSHCTNTGFVPGFTPTGGYTPAIVDHTQSTNTGSEATFRNILARMEFQAIYGTGSTSDPTIETSPATFFPVDANIFAVFAVVGTVTGLLHLQSINNINAALIRLENSTIYSNFDFFYFRNKGSSVNNSYIRGTDGAFIGPVHSTSNLLDMAADTDGDAVSRGAIIVGTSALKWGNQPVGAPHQFVGTIDGVDTAFYQITHSWLNGLNSDDHTQYLNLNGRSGGQVLDNLGNTHSGGSINDMAFHGRIIVDPQNQNFAYVTNRIFDFRLKPTSNLTNYFLITQSYASMTGGGSSALMLCINTGTIPAAGSPQSYTITGPNFSSSVNANTNVTITENCGAIFSVNSAAGSGTVAKLTGGRFQALTTGSGTIANGITGLEILLGQGGATVDVKGIAFLEGGSNFTGTLSNLYWIDLGSTAPLNYATVVNWTGIRIPDAPTNPTGTIRGLAIGNIKSHHTGPFRFGDTTTPTHYIEIAAGTTTIAPIKLTSATPITTAVAGCIEFQTDDFFATITTGAARKAFILDDGTRLTSGRVPFATTNGRLIDDADFTFAIDTLTITKIAATTLTGLLTLADAINIAVGTTTGTKIGTATSQKLGFWNTSPVIQPTTGITGATVTHVGGASIQDNDTFDGYTLAQVVAALRQIGILA